MSSLTTTAEITTIVEWLRTWQVAINERDYEAARRLFDPSVLGFGTRAKVARGLDDLVDSQWRPTWPVIADFRFDIDDMVVLAAGENRAILATWTSLGLREDGSDFDRSGRMTLLLRHDKGESWKAIHTHFSLTPGTEVPPP